MWGVIVCWVVGVVGVFFVDDVGVWYWVVFWCGVW